MLLLFQAKIIQRPPPWLASYDTPIIKWRPLHYYLAYSLFWITHYISHFVFNLFYKDSKFYIWYNLYFLSILHGSLALHCLTQLIWYQGNQIFVWISSTSELITLNIKWLVSAAYYILWFVFMYYADYLNWYWFCRISSGFVHIRLSVYYVTCPQSLEDGKLIWKKIFHQCNVWS
jgi:hypothetical protein